MKILTLELFNLFGTKKLKLIFSEPNDDTTPPVYLIEGQGNWESISMALLMICSCVYDNMTRIKELGPGISKGKIELCFVLTVKVQATDCADDGHSSDSDVPCTSTQARQRAEARLRRQNQGVTVKSYIIRACRDFKRHPLLIEYTVNNGPINRRTVKAFNKTFFTCTDVLLPNIDGLISGDCMNGRWLSLLTPDYVYRGKGDNDLLVRFCKLFSTAPVELENTLCNLTTTILVGRYSVERTRIAYLIQIFQHIRLLFEYLTFSEYTVWFLLPQLFGDLCDICDIRTDNIDFELMQTKIQLKTEGSPRYPWTDADGYIRELFLIAVQLAFGFNCKQNIVYLYSITNVEKYQLFEYTRYIFACNSGGRKLWPYKNYMQRIIDACGKCELTCIIEFTKYMDLRENSYTLMLRE